MFDCSGCCGQALAGEEVNVIALLKLFMFPSARRSERDVIIYLVRLAEWCSLSPWRGSWADNLQIISRKSKSAAQKRINDCGFYNLIGHCVQFLYGKKYLMVPKGVYKNTARNGILYPHSDGDSFLPLTLSCTILSDFASLWFQSFLSKVFLY